MSLRGSSWVSVRLRWFPWVAVVLRSSAFPLLGFARSFYFLVRVGVSSCVCVVSLLLSVCDNRLSCFVFCASASLRLLGAASMGVPGFLSVPLRAGCSWCASCGFVRLRGFRVRVRDMRRSLLRSCCVSVSWSEIVGRSPSFIVRVGAFPWVSVGVSESLWASVGLRASA